MRKSDELLKFFFTRLQEIQFDLSNFCNLRCPMCYCSYHKFNEYKFLAKDLWKKVIDEVFYFPESLVKMIKLYWIGEPLLHPDFLYFVEYLFKRKLQRDFFFHIMTSTNGNLWFPSFSKSFFDLFISAIKRGMSEDSFLVVVFSLDAIYSKTYHKVKPGGNLERVMENIIRFLEIRKKYKLKYPILTLQFVVQEDNYSELNDFIHFWKKVFAEFRLPLKVYYSWWHDNDTDHIAIQPCTAHFDPQKQRKLYDLYLKAIDDYTKTLGFDPFGDYSNRFRRRFSLYEEFPQTKSDCNYTGDTDRQPCNSLFFAPNIKSTGDVTICCRQALTDENNVGNLKDDSFFNIWTGEKINSYRKEQIAGIFSRGCQECYSQEQWGYLKRDLILEYCDIIGDNIVREKYLKRIKVMN